jgi:hypothetical protein
VVLDTSAKAVSSKDYAWLERDLQSSIMPQAIVFTHVPLRDPRPFWKHDLDDEKQAQRLQKLFDLNRVSVVIASHIHGYYDYTLDGVRYIITGGAGAPMDASGAKNHIVAATVKGDRIGLKKIDIGTGDSVPARVWYMLHNLLGIIWGSPYLISILSALTVLFAVMAAMESKRS